MEENQQILNHIFEEMKKINSSLQNKNQMLQLKFITKLLRNLDSSVAQIGNVLITIKDSMDDYIYTDSEPEEDKE